MTVGDGTLAISVPVAFIAELELRKYWRRRCRALKQKKKDEKNVEEKNERLDKDRWIDRERETYFLKISL